MRRFHLASASILACVTGFGKKIVPLFRLWIWGGLLWVNAQLMECFGKDRVFRCFREFGDEWFHNFRLPLVANAFLFLRPVVKSMNAGQVPFLKQLRLSLQPMLHVVSGQ